jgi:hypothetical protein
MIQVASKRILINQNGVAPLLQEVDSLHDRLTESFKACGIQNSWMADDMLIAVHACLKVNFNLPQTEESLDQIHASLIKALDDNGFPVVAQHFSESLQNNSLSELLKKINTELKQLSVSIPRRTTQAVLNKVLTLGYDHESISALLIREICLLEVSSSQQEISEDNTNPLDFIPFDAKYVNWDWDFLTMKAAGHLFNSVRVDLYPLRLARSMNMDTFIEILFMKEWLLLIEQASSYLQSCLHHFSEINDNKIDYISIVTHDLEELSESCNLGKNPPLLTDLNQSVTAAFESVLKQFSDVSFIKK